MLRFALFAFVGICDQKNREKKQCASGFLKPAEERFKAHRSHVTRNPDLVTV